MLILCRNKHVDEHQLYLFHRLLKTEYALPQAVKIILNVRDKTSVTEIYFKVRIPGRCDTTHNPKFLMCKSISSPQLVALFPFPTSWKLQTVSLIRYFYYSIGYFHIVADYGGCTILSRGRLQFML